MKKSAEIKNYNELPTYEIHLPYSFNIAKFSDDAERGEERFWLVNVERQPGIWRYKGVVLGNNVRVFIDIFQFHQMATRKEVVMFVTTPIYQNMSAREVADLAFVCYGGLKMYHEGREVET